MARVILSIVFLSWLCVTGTCLSQGESALPFLLISPTAEANGMGEAAVANHTDDPLALIYNPAHLGMMSLTTHVSFGHNYARWLPGFDFLDLSIRTYGFNAGINLGSIIPDFPQIGVGAAYSRIYLPYGTFNVTSPIGPEVIRTFDSYESSDQYTIGVGINSIVRASAGTTVKHVVSKLSAPAEAKVTLYDYGFFLDVPTVDILSELSGSPIRCTPHIAPYADWSVGVSLNNLGKESITYTDPSQADLLPRYARAGMGFDIGMIYSRDDLKLKLLSFKWSIEANDLLVTGYGNSYSVIQTKRQ
jgi:hypothetical protein